jgi:AAA15 family ATPase/GTPase
MIAPVLEAENRTDYRMIESLTIKDFRCFENVSLHDLKRVNIIVGRNASGKTALLESIYLTLGVPALTFKIKQWRGLGDVYQVNERSETINALWRDLFYRFEQNRIASIAFKGSSDLTRTLTIRHETESGVKLPVSKEGAEIQPLSHVSFEWWKASRRIGAVKPEYKDGELKISGGPEPLPGAFYSSSNPVNPRETADWFSDLSKARNEKNVIKAIQGLFPFINDLSVETHNGIPMVHADILTMPEKIPVGLVSSGVNKLLALLVAIARQNHGILIVDEIENGFHYKTINKIWGVLYQFCKDSHVQLFASTHSGECLEAIAAAMEGHERDFCLLRAVKEDEGCNIKQFSGDQMRGAIEQEMELR